MKYRSDLEYEVSRMIRTGDLSRISERKELFDESQGENLLAGYIEKVLRQEFLADDPPDASPCCKCRNSSECTEGKSKIIPFPSRKIIEGI